ncbi:MAG: hydrogenase maturation nickel metallochaperone HypA [Armatimonadota bacterium]|nr:hydrogenase maturation nickel metallochaperone HypA [Armatimonadota bacterium]
MHDITAAQGIARTVLQAAAERDAERVERVRIVLGAMQMIDPEQLQFWLGHILRGTIGQDAQIDIERRPLMIRCEACGYKGEVDVPEDPIYHLMAFAPACPECGSHDLQVLGGDECIVQSIRVTAPDGQDDGDA